MNHFCKSCNQWLLLRNLNRHLKSKKHNKNIDIFSIKTQKKFNDYSNKIREEFLLKFVNGVKVDKELEEIKEKFIVILKTNIYIDHDTIILEKRGGRKYNYDFELLIYKNLFFQNSIKIEFKYGCKDIYNYPQFISLYCKNSLLLRHNYIEFWFNKFLDKYLEFFKLKKPDYNDYIKYINDTRYKYFFFNHIYTVLKKDKNIREQTNIIVRQSIETYLNYIDISDINFKYLNHILLKQPEKLFIFYDQNNFYSNYLEPMTINKKKIRIINKNTIQLYSLDEKFCINILLRWKNYNGCCSPAYQISIKQTKNL